MATQAAEEQRSIAFVIALKSGLHSDFEIVCGKDVYAVHKVIITALSPYFDNAVKFDAAGKEKEDERIEFPEDDPLLIKALVQFMYELDYDLPPLPQAALLHQTRPPPRVTSFLPPAPARCPHGFDHFFSCPKDHSKHAPEHLALHAALYTLADKYLMPALQDLCAEKFKDCAHLYCRTPEFPRAIEMIFAELPQGDVKMKMAVIETLTDQSSLCLEPKINALLHDHSDLSVGVIENAVKESNRINFPK
ncbi:hypothetical protein BDV96DRAFT_673809 [Lophiotrema nucula]|uniref:BTB domain-containing protein n=1 Tax=Lophiotrema nucula TaxID=690887 RepID=A0A6A5YJ65_9PLEO|nr:hypothetical protein BDV96DRAFT_673809 [Lophiotrema nucula]